MKVLYVVCLGFALLSGVVRAQEPPVPTVEQPQAEQQPVTPVAPAISVPTNPPDPVHSFWGDLVSPRALLATAPGTLLDQIHEFPKQWGTGVSGAEKRAASLYGQFVVGDLIERGVTA